MTLCSGGEVATGHEANASAMHLMKMSYGGLVVNSLLPPGFTSPRID